MTKPQIKISQLDGGGWQWRMIHNFHGISGLTMEVARSFNIYRDYYTAYRAMKRVAIILKNPRLRNYDKDMPKEYRTCPYFELSEWLGKWAWSLYGKAGHLMALSGEDVAPKEMCEDRIKFFTDNFHMYILGPRAKQDVCIS